MWQCGNIVLVGLSGAGKTSCAQILANLLGMSVLDTDHVIQEKEGRTVAAIFADDGEAHFRSLETALIKNLLEGKLCDTVVSVGGGLPAHGENAQLLKKLGFTVFLDAPPETIAGRLAADLSRDHGLRPLLAGKSNCKEEEDAEAANTSEQKNKSENLSVALTAQLAKRRKYYEEAHLVINTDGRTTEEICLEIQTIIANKRS